MNKWWGYKHVDGTIHVKRFYDDKDITEATESDFVEKVTFPYLAGGRDEALMKAKAALK